MWEEIKRPPFAFLRRLQDMRSIELEQAKNNQFLASALEQEKMEGHRLAVIARTAALFAVMILLPFLNPTWSVLFIEVILVFFIAFGWLQYKMASVGRSNIELAFIFCDLLFMTVIATLPNPFMSEVIPTALTYRFDAFIYFFIFLALATLAYSWRTMFAIGTWVAVLWLIGFTAVVFFGHQIPELTVAAQNAFSGHAIVTTELDPNSIQPSVRVQEIVVFLIVAIILTIKSWRSNQMLMRQADIATERANLSRYFPSSLVDVLASTDHDIGAVRSQDVAVLFTDIVGFTQYAEKHSPDEVMALLRQYHAFVERAIFQNKGTLDKYLGDGVMATFGTPETSPMDATNALAAAKQIMEDTKAFNQERHDQGLISIDVSIGVHYGPVILGDIGPARRLEFAVLGDTVNVASRLEATTRQLDCQCVVSADLMQNIGTNDETHFTPQEQLRLRGRNTPINVWTA